MLSHLLRIPNKKFNPWFLLYKIGDTTLPFSTEPQTGRWDSWDFRIFLGLIIITEWKSTEMMPILTGHGESGTNRFFSLCGKHSTKKKHRFSVPSSQFHHTNPMSFRKNTKENFQKAMCLCIKLWDIRIMLLKNFSKLQRKNPGLTIPFLSLQPITETRFITLIIMAKRLTEEPYRF